MTERVVKVFSESVRALRVMNGLTITALADLLGWEHARIVAVEHRALDLTEAEAECLAAALGVSVDALRSPLTRDGLVRWAAGKRMTLRAVKPRALVD